MIDLAVSVLLLVGGAFCLVAAVGLLRFPDVFMRMHAGTKAGTLGVGLTLAALALDAGTIESAARAAIAVAFVLITAPVAAHVAGRAAYRARTRLWQGTVIDELEGSPGQTAEDQPETPRQTGGPD